MMEHNQGLDPKDQDAVAAEAQVVVLIKGNVTRFENFLLLAILPDIGAGCPAIQLISHLKLQPGDALALAHCLQKEATRVLDYAVGTVKSYDLMERG